MPNVNVYNIRTYDLEYYNKAIKGTVRFNAEFNGESAFAKLIGMPKAKLKKFVDDLLEDRYKKDGIPDHIIDIDHVIPTELDKYDVEFLKNKIYPLVKSNLQKKNKLRTEVLDQIKKKIEKEFMDWAKKRVLNLKQFKDVKDLKIEVDDRITVKFEDCEIEDIYPKTGNSVVMFQFSIEAPLIFKGQIKKTKVKKPGYDTRIRKIEKHNVGSDLRVKINSSYITGEILKVKYLKHVNEKGNEVPLFNVLYEGGDAKIRRKVNLTEKDLPVKVLED